MQTDAEMKLHPQCPESETVYVGTLLLGGQRAQDLFEDLTEDEFFIYQNVIIIRAMIAARRKTVHAGRAEYKAEMIAAKTWEDIRTPGYFNMAVAAAAGAADTMAHIENVREKASARRMLLLLDEIKGNIVDSVMPIRDLAAHFETAIFKAAEIKERKDLTTWKAAVSEAMHDLNDRRKPDGKRPVPTGFHELDTALVGGWRGGTFTVIGGRPGLGKTSFATSLAITAARSGTPSLFFSLEMRESELGARTLAMEAGVGLSLILGTANIDSARMDRLIRAQDEATAPLLIDDTPLQTMASIGAAARRAVRKHNVGLIVIDYLQLIRHDGGKNERQDVKVGNTSRDLKLLSRVLNVPVIALAQFNRESDKRVGGRPQLSDLRDSGNIEQDADNVLLLWGQPHPDGHEVQEVILCIDKQRNGPKTQVSLDLRRPLTRFENRSHH